MINTRLRRNKGKVKNLAEEFRRGVAEAIGVSPEDINPDVVEKWVKEWTRAFLTPEAFRRVFGHSSPTYVELATIELIKHILSLNKRYDTDYRVRRSRGL